MRQALTKLTQNVDRLSLRERLFIFAAGLLMLGAFWEAGLAGPLTAREQLANDKFLALQQRLAELDGLLNVAAAGVSEGVPDQLERLRALRASVQARDEEMRVFTTDLVDPKDMRLVLEELLRAQDGLELVNAVNRPAQAVIEDDERPGPDASVETTAGSEAPNLYRHTFVLTLRGSYIDTLRYLEAVERLPWHIYWSRLELSTDKYPVNDISIELATLSLDAEWIGV